MQVLLQQTVVPRRLVLRAQHAQKQPKMSTVVTVEITTTAVEVL